MTIHATTTLIPVATGVRAASRVDGRMTPEGLLGQRVTLTLDRIGTAGGFLAVEPRPGAATVFLPARELPADAAVGQALEVFVYRDSEEQIVATTATPRLTIGEVAFLQVTARADHGAYVDWGLGKELFVPYAEQTRELEVGAWHPFGLYLDKSERLAATMRVHHLLTEGGDFELDEWVEGVAWRDEPGVGLFAILERAFVGVVPADEPHRLQRGDAGTFRVAHILPDGKLVLSLRGHAYHELAHDAEAILAALGGPNPPRVGDRSSPDEIRDRFGLSKKAFKRAVGRLLKDGAVRIDADGCVVKR
ncbi:MAG: nucleic acid-binding protein [Myxococcales bacterium]|nr:nucleic acid-binding protein [Myxococcales bacterium]